MNEWNEVKLGGFCDITMGQSPKSQFCNSVGEGQPLLNGPTEFGFTFPKAIQFTTDAKKQSEKGDLLFCVRGSTTGRMNWADKNYAIGRGLAAICHKNGKEYNPFVKGLIEFKLKEILNSATGSTFPNVGKELLNKLSVKVPPLSQQKVIAYILSTLDGKIEVNNQINKTLEKMAQAIFKQWFVDFEFPNEDGEPYRSSGGEMVESELGLIPKGWKVGILGDLIQITSGKRPSSRSDKNESNFIFPLVGASSVMGFSEEYNFCEAVLVIGRVGTHGIVQRFDRKIWASDNTLVIKSKMYEYVYQILNFIDYSALNRGSTQPLITQTDIKNYSILVPSLSVLNSFQNTVGTLFKSVINNQNENEILKNIRDEFLPKLMSGEIKAL